ncbi:carboxypeptidase-like regulatory domain-containing protein [Pontibacter sp. MBLB2868]|uniref:carboxypeptidase-like regulatory domain-containing protein n=1 Tax=Pontibacter sp. MBLB2868 TaxID=3451555 RepID=UPI003F74B4F6
MHLIRVSLLLSTLFALQTAFGQTLRLQGIISAHSTHEGLPYASIGVQHTATGTSADLQGSFKLQALLTDTLVISAVGFKTAYIAVAELKPAIYLQSDTTALAEVVVRAKKRRMSARVGNLKSETFLSLGGANQYAMLLLPPSPIGGVLDEAFFALQPDTRKHGRWRTALRVRVYANKVGKPGLDLLPENVIVSVDKTTKKLVVDLSQYGISVPREGVFLGLDLLGYFDEEERFVPFSRQTRPVNLRVKFSDSPSPFQTFNRFFGTGWQEVRHRTRSGDLIPMFAQFGARISY